MSFPRYPEYKDSGVVWLGEVPAHWEPIRYKNVFREKTFCSGAHLQAGSISFGRVVFKDDEAMNEATKATYQEVLRGEFLINPINLNYDLKSLRTALSEIDTCVSPAYIVLQGKFDFDKSFMKHQLSVFDVRHMKTLGAGVRQTISFSDIGACLTQLPPPAEQTQIAAFLDRETAKIDELVTEQRRLMELLKEKRQAVISHAVTKGLNPDAPMKPSGIEWLGEVPAHWEVKRLKYLGVAIIGLTYSPADVVDEINGTLVLRSSNVQGGKLAFDDNVYVSTPIPETLLTRAGDILICSRNGSRALIGKNAVIDEGSANITFGAFMTIFRSRHSAYISCVLNSPLFEFQAGSFLTSTINQLTVGVLNNFEIPFPPAHEREEISKFLSTETNRLDTLTAEAQRAIDLLQERRTALISAAVTGQIDVRQLTEKQAA